MQCILAAILLSFEEKYKNSKMIHNRFNVLVIIFDTDENNATLYHYICYYF